MSVLHGLLAPLSLESLLYLMAETNDEGLQKNLSRYITQWRHEKVDITGEDLKNMGLSPGPLFSQILRAVLQAKLDGETPGREEQLALARSLARNRTKDEGKKLAAAKRNN